MACSQRSVAARRQVNTLGYDRAKVFLDRELVLRVGGTIWASRIVPSSSIS